MSNLSTNDNFVTMLQMLKKLQLALFMNASHLMRFNHVTFKNMFLDDCLSHTSFDCHSHGNCEI